MRATARTTGTGATLIGTAAALGLSAWLVLLLAAVAGLAVVLPVWAAALIVFGVLALPAAVLAAMAARWLARARPLLPLTTESLREDLRATREWAQR